MLVNLCRLSSKCSCVCVGSLVSARVCVSALYVIGYVCRLLIKCSGMCAGCLVSLGFNDNDSISINCKLKQITLF